MSFDYRRAIGMQALRDAGFTLRDAGRVYGVSPERTRQILAKLTAIDRKCELTVKAHSRHTGNKMNWSDNKL